MKKRKRKNAASVKDHQGAADALHKATTYLDEALKHVNGRVPATEIDGLLRAKKYARDAGSMLEDRMFRDHGSDRESMGTYYPRDRIVPPGEALIDAMMTMQLDYEGLARIADTRGDPAGADAWRLVVEGIAHVMRLHREACAHQTETP